MSRSELIRPSRRLPEMVLSDAAGMSHRVRPAGDRSVLLILAHDGCDECRRWILELAGQRGEIAAWKGEVRVVANAPDASVPYQVLIDPDGRLAAAASVTAPAVVVADQWGEIHEAAEGHAFVPIASAVEWIRHLATRCPECEGEAY